MLLIAFSFVCIHGVACSDVRAVSWLRQRDVFDDPRVNTRDVSHVAWSVRRDIWNVRREHSWSGLQVVPAGQWVAHISTCGPLCVVLKWCTLKAYSNQVAISHLKRQSLALCEYEETALCRQRVSSDVFVIPGHGVSLFIKYHNTIFGKSQARLRILLAGIQDREFCGTEVFQWGRTAKIETKSPRSWILFFSFHGKIKSQFDAW